MQEEIPIEVITFVKNGVQSTEDQVEEVEKAAEELASAIEGIESTLKDDLNQLNQEIMEVPTRDDIMAFLSKLQNSIQQREEQSLNVNQVLTEPTTIINNENDPIVSDDDQEPVTVSDNDEEDSTKSDNDDNWEDVPNKDNSFLNEYEETNDGYKALNSYEDETYDNFNW